MVFFCRFQELPQKVLFWALEWQPLNTNRNSVNSRAWVTRESIAEHFGISVRTVANFQRRRILPFVKVGGLVRFNVVKCEQALMKFESASIFVE